MAVDVTMPNIGRAGLLVDAFLGPEDRPLSRVPGGASTAGTPLGDAQAAVAHQALLRTTSASLGNPSCSSPPLAAAAGESRSTAVTINLLDKNSGDYLVTEKKTGRKFSGTASNAGSFEQGQDVWLEAAPGFAQRFFTLSEDWQDWGLHACGDWLDVHVRIVEGSDLMLRANREVAEEGVNEGGFAELAKVGKEDALINQQAGFRIAARWSDLSEADAIDKGMEEHQRELVQESLGRAHSFTCSGPPQQGARTIPGRLASWCNHPNCSAPGKPHRLIGLLPLMVDGKKRDCCYECTTTHEAHNPGTPENIQTQKYFQAACAMSRAKEMERLPLDAVDPTKRLKSMAHDIHKQLLKDCSPDEKKLLMALNPKTIEKMLKEARDGIRDPANVEKFLFAPAHLGSSMAALRMAYEKLGEQRMAVLERGLDFTRGVYGTERTVLQIMLQWTCNWCGACPESDYDWIVMVLCGQWSGWYCITCGRKYDKSSMNSVLGIRSNLPDTESFVARVRWPSGRMCNVLTYLKFVNCVRTGAFSVSVDDAATIRTLMQDIRSMIDKDNSVAVSGMKALGAQSKVVPVMAPDIDMSCCPQGHPAQSANELTLNFTDVGCQKRVLMLHEALTVPVEGELSSKLVQKALALVFSMLGTAAKQLCSGCR